jgi:integrase
MEPTKMAASKPALMTPKSIAGMRRGESASDPAPRGEGVLQARKLAGGKMAFYFRYCAPNGERVRHKIGTGLTLKDARAEAAKLSRRYQAGDQDLRAAIAEEEAQAAREREAQARAAEVREQSKKATLGALMLAYVAQLRALGKSSASKVMACCDLHLIRAHPRLANKPADEVTIDDAISIVGPLVDVGNRREAAKLRSYMRAAFAAAIRARNSADAAPALRAFKLRSNPVRDLEAIQGANIPDTRAPLSLSALRCYWRRVSELPEPTRSALRLHLLLGGQRPAQLARATVADIDGDTITLRDPKGRRTSPRLHVLPLLPEAVEAIATLRNRPKGPLVWSLDGGLSGIRDDALRKTVKAIASAMVAADEVAAPFSIKLIRATVETRLAEAKVSSDVRAHLQSHGLGGLQARHYDRHGYMPEKLAALETLRDLLSAEPASVTPIKLGRNS